MLDMRYRNGGHTYTVKPAHQFLKLNIKYWLIIDILINNQIPLNKY